MPRLERKYVLTKLDTGDYLLPGNNGRTLFRIARSEGEGWDVCRYIDPLKLGHEAPKLDWSYWECVAQQEPTRASAIQEALRLST